MNKREMIAYLVSEYEVTWCEAEDNLKANDWVLWMAAGDIRDEAAKS